MLTQFKGQADYLQKREQKTPVWLETWGSLSQILKSTVIFNKSEFRRPRRYSL